MLLIIEIQGPFLVCVFLAQEKKYRNFKIINLPQSSNLPIQPTLVIVLEEEQINEENSTRIDEMPINLSKVSHQTHSYMHFSDSSHSQHLYHTENTMCFQWKENMSSIIYPLHRTTFFIKYLFITCPEKTKVT